MPLSAGVHTMAGFGQQSPEFADEWSNFKDLAWHDDCRRTRREVTIVDELRTAWRSVIRSRGLAGVLLISLGLGTGANATVFTAVNRLLFEPPPGVADRSTLIEIFTAGLDGSSYGRSSHPDFESIA